MKIQVLLVENIPGVGKKDQVREVQDGYARNYLFPKKLAVSATPGALKALGTQQTAKEQSQAKERGRYEELARRIEKESFIFILKAGEKGKAFGSVTVSDIMGEFDKKKIHLSKEWIRLEHPIKTLGKHDVPLILPHSVSGTLSLDIRPE